MKIIDAHVHIRDAAGGHAAIFELARKLGYEKFSAMSTSCYDPVQNVVCGLFKRRYPGQVYAFGGLEYVTGRDFKTQAENLMAIGFDGIKMLEGKPTTRRRLGKALDDSDYDGLYSFMEDNGHPMLLHVVDPNSFWDKNRVPDWALANGWYYGEENDAPYEQYYAEVENMLRKHPRLKAIFAHFFFLSWNIQRAQKFLDDHPSVYIDVTAGVEMYEDFSLDPKMWRAFFVKNQDRIIFGTDSTDEPPADNGKVALNGYAGMEIEFLQYDREIEIYGKHLHGIGLPDDALRKIFAENYIKLVSDTPKKINIDLLRKEDGLLRKFLTEKDTKRLDECKL